MVVCDQACYGHTEGTAGITGALLAITALRQSAAAPIVNLRSVNPYVTAALSDWGSLKGLDAHAPRQLAPGPLLGVCGYLISTDHILLARQAALSEVDTVPRMITACRSFCFICYLQSEMINIWIRCTNTP
jgi:hypothetical protein